MEAIFMAKATCQSAHGYFGDGFAREGLLEEDDSIGADLSRSFCAKQKMVEYYLVGSGIPRPWENQQIEEHTSISRLLSASDYISAYYKANGFVPQVVADHLWERLFDFQEQLASEAKTEGPTKSGNNPTKSVDDPMKRPDKIAIYTQLVTFAASAWRHILGELPAEQQSELICLVLHSYFRDGGVKFLDDCREFLSRGGKSCKDMSTPRRSAVPLCGLMLVSSFSDSNSREIFR